MTSASWAEQELEAFQQVDLAPQEAARLTFGIPARELSIVDAQGRRIVEAGEFELRIGSSSRTDAQLRASFTVVPVPWG